MSLSATALVTLAQAKAHLRVAQAVTLTVSAEYVGVGDGEAVVFTLDHTPLEGSIKVFVDSTLKTYTTDYSVSGTSLTFTTAGKPALNKAITASYDYTAATDTYESMDDDLIEGLIESATREAESYTGRAFVQRSVTESHNGHGDTIRLYKTPVASITSVSYRVVSVATGDGDTLAFTLAATPKADSLSVYVDGVLQTITTHYTLSSAVVTFVEAPSDGALIAFRYEVSLHVVNDYTEKLHTGRLTGSFETDTEYIVSYTVGYASTRALAQVACPDAVQAVLLIIAYLYEHYTDMIDSEDRGIGNVSYKLPSDAMKLLNHYKVAWI